MKTSAVVHREKPDIAESAEPTAASAGFVRRAGALFLREIRELLRCSLITEQSLPAS